MYIQPESDRHALATQAIRCNHGRWWSIRKSWSWGRWGNVEEGLWKLKYWWSSIASITNVPHPYTPRTSNTHTTEHEHVHNTTKKGKIKQPCESRAKSTRNGTWKSTGTGRNKIPPRRYNIHRPTRCDAMVLRNSWTEQYYCVRKARHKYTSTLRKQQFVHCMLLPRPFYWWTWFLVRNSSYSLVLTALILPVDFVLINFVPDALLPLGRAMSRIRETDLHNYKPYAI